LPEQRLSRIAACEFYQWHAYSSIMHHLPWLWPNESCLKPVPPVLAALFDVTYIGRVWPSLRGERGAQTGYVISKPTMPYKMLLPTRREMSTGVS